MRRITSLANAVRHRHELGAVDGARERLVRARRLQQPGHRHRSPRRGQSAARDAIAECLRAGQQRDRHAGAQAVRDRDPILANASSAAAPFFTGLTSSIAQQFLQVAKLIEARGATGAKRQIFFVQLGSFDTHNDQVRRQQNLFADFAPALKAFYDSTVAMSVAGQVTTFTLSDFGRTLQPASGGGTDHAWGSHHFVVGDAVKGGDLDGRYPQLILRGPDDAESEGRWIPTTSVDQYGATLATWFGVGTTQLATIFPNLARFPVSNVGFMA